MHTLEKMVRDGQARDGEMVPRPSDDPEKTRQELHDHLVMFCDTIGERPTGSEKNRLAGEYLKKNLGDLGYSVEMQEFEIPGWIREKFRLRWGGKNLPGVINTYSPSCSVTAPLVFAGTKKELESSDPAGKILVLHGDLTREPLMPRNFRFYTHEEHCELARLLEEKNPAALVTVSPCQDHAVPVIIDADFTLPSCTVTTPVYHQLRAHAGEPAAVLIKTETRMTTSSNVIGRLATKPGRSKKKIVLTAHFDTKFETPGALDNATGTASLLCLARRFSDQPAGTDLELVFFNGEECYSAPGECTYLDSGSCTPDRVAFGINIDGIGLHDRDCSISYYECPAPLLETAATIVKKYPGIVQIDPWPQGDHMIFFMQGISCMAFSTHATIPELSTIIHTPSDTREILDEGKILACTGAVEELVRAYEKND